MENNISVNDLEKMIAECFLQRNKYDAAKEIASQEHERMEQMQQKIIATLEELNLTSYKSQVGTFGYRYEESFLIPKDLENRQKFFDFLKQKGVYDTMISVNSKTLNAFAKAEMAAEEAAGQLDYQIPGLQKSAPVARATMRKA